MRTFYFTKFLQLYQEENQTVNSVPQTEKLTKSCLSFWIAYFDYLT